MSLISTTNLLAYTDYLGAINKKLKSVADPVANQASPTISTLQAWAKNLETLITTTCADYQQQSDLLADAHATLIAINQEAIAKSALNTAVQALQRHIQTRGSSVDSSINSLSTYLSYYNGGGGGSLFNKLVCPEFNTLWYNIFSAYLPPVGVMSPAIQPRFNTSASANGLASRAIGSSIVLGDSVNTTLYSAVVPMLEVTVVFGGGSAPPAYVITGTDHLGNATATWTVTLTGNNPVSAVSTTITPAVTGQSRQAVAIGSATGIVAGSVLIVNAGLIDEEVIVVETLVSTTLTAAFQLAHTAGATLTGYSTYALTPVNGARIVSVSAIAPTVTGTSSGTVRIVGRQDRVQV